MPCTRKSRGFYKIEGICEYWLKKLLVTDFITEDLCTSERSHIIEANFHTTELANIISSMLEAK